MRDKVDPWESIENFKDLIKRHGMPTYELYGWSWDAPEEERLLSGLEYATARLAWAGFRGNVFETPAAVEILKCLGFSGTNNLNARERFEAIEQRSKAEGCEGIAYSVFIAFGEIYAAFSGVFPHEKASDKALADFDGFVQSYMALAEQCPAPAFKSDMESGLPWLRIYRDLFAHMVEETNLAKEHLSGTATPHDLRWAVALKCLAPILDPALKHKASPGRGGLLHLCKAVVDAQFKEQIDDANLRRIRRDMPFEMTDFTNR